MVNGFFYGIDSIGNFFAVGAAGLSHVRATAAALSADCLRGNAYQVYGRVTTGQIFGDADDDRGFVVFVGGEDDNAGAQLGRDFVNESFQLFGVNIGDSTADKFDSVDQFEIVPVVSSFVAGKTFFLLQRGRFPISSFRQEAV